MTKISDDSAYKSLSNAIREGYASHVQVYQAALVSDLAELRDAYCDDPAILNLLVILEADALEFYSTLSVSGSARQRDAQEKALNTLAALGED